MVLVLLLLGVAFSAALFSYLSPIARTINNDQVTAAALAQARDALIGWAARAPTPGTLPCPDVDNNGTADSPCSAAGVSVIGRLPWKTLGLPDLRDGSGECLWYAVSGAFKNSPPSKPLNSDTNGQFIIMAGDGVTPLAGSSAQTNAIAIVFAPGAAMPGNDRSGPVSLCGGNTTAANYLDAPVTPVGFNNAVVSAVAYATSTMIETGPSDSFNDRLLFITPEQFFPSVELRVAREIRSSLSDYFTSHNYYPFASTYGDPAFDCVPGLTRGRLPKPGGAVGFDISAGCAGLANWPPLTPPAWFTENNWHLLTYYTVAAACSPTTPNCSGIGLLTVNNTPAPENDKRALLIVAGRALGQARPCASEADCMESENNIPDDIYVRNTVTSSFNDKVMIVAP